MRQIKFRAWVKISKSMETVMRVNWTDVVDMGLYFHGVQTTRGVEGEPDMGRHYQAHEVELMQYTGLKDKNGKEIYEGDILHEYEEVVDPWRNDNSKDYTQDEVYEVRFLTENIGTYFGCWQPSKYFPEKGHTTWIKPKTMEVIGNRFENPELLENPEATDQQQSNEATSERSTEAQAS